MKYGSFIRRVAILAGALSIVAAGSARAESWWAGYVDEAKPGVKFTEVSSFMTVPKVNAKKTNVLSSLTFFWVGIGGRLSHYLNQCGVAERIWPDGKPHYDLWWEAVGSNPGETLPPMYDWWSDEYGHGPYENGHDAIHPGDRIYMDVKTWRLASDGDFLYTIKDSTTNQAWYANSSWSTLAGGPNPARDSAEVITEKASALAADGVRMQVAYGKVQYDNAGVQTDQTGVQDLDLRSNAWYSVEKIDMSNQFGVLESKTGPLLRSGRDFSTQYRNP